MFRVCALSLHDLHHVLAKECDVCEADIEVSSKFLYCERSDYAICETCAVEMLRREALKA